MSPHNKVRFPRLAHNQCHLFQTTNQLPAIYEKGSGCFSFVDIHFLPISKKTTDQKHRNYNKFSSGACPTNPLSHYWLILSTAYLKCSWTADDQKNMSFHIICVSPDYTSQDTLNSFDLHKNVQIFTKIHELV